MMEEIQNQRMQLPIYSFKDQILETVKGNKFCIITGDTGSGKSTQLPQYLIDDESLKHLIFADQENCPSQLNIVVTQPRRIAAISMAKRICYERQCKLRDEIGYTIRFDDQTSSKTYLRYVTDGILVRKCLQDPLLSKYNVIILDEAHERSLYTDILFSLVKKAVLERNDGLKLIITSATLNTDLFSKYFNNCPLIKMKGHSFPVDIKYGPTLMNKRVEESVKAAIRMHLHEGPGDILVFLTGSEECDLARKICHHQLTELLARGKEVPAMLIYALYGTQSSDEQSLIFSKGPENTRKVIFSTNIAETSLTIDNIGFVIDCGYVKQKIYNPRTGMDALLVVPISKVQAVQRAGRAGRTQIGKCYRMYSEQFFKQEMKDYTVPEILRVNLSNVVLQLKSMGINDVINFDFMENPDSDAILQALKQLFLLKAIDQDGKITVLGQQMCRFPLEPSYSKALLTSLLLNCSDEMVTLVSLLSSEYIWNRPTRVREAEFEKFCKIQKEFLDLEGDHQTLIKIYRRWKRNIKDCDYFCKSNFLNLRALALAENIKHQLNDLLRTTDLKLLLGVYQADFAFRLFSDSTVLDRDYLKRPKFCNTEQLEQEQIKERKLQKQLTPSEVFRLSLVSGFFFNSARKVRNDDSQYLLIYPEGNLVEIDSQSVFSLEGTYPNSVIFTELAGVSNIRGVIKLLSEVDLDWVQGYLRGIGDIDLYRLAGIQNDAQRKLQELQSEEQLRHHEQEQKLKNNQEIRQTKILAAKERYNERKKIKI